MANLTKCMICGAVYNYCPSCSGTHAWKFYTDTHEHYQIYMIIEQYNAKDYAFTKDDARKAFANIGITEQTDLSGLKPSIAKQIKEIIKTTETDSEAKNVLKRTKRSKLYNDKD